MTDCLNLPDLRTHLQNEPLAKPKLGLLILNKMGEGGKVHQDLHRPVTKVFWRKLCRPLTNQGALLLGHRDVSLGWQAVNSVLGKACTIKNHMTRNLFAPVEHRRPS
ncbi:unnamed protein product [Pleuronectes platessa]|uniref:Uncharacterized protein n=1 Tax=Pleuronectes platessa TaxID=8262 RepID=A0A9N7TKZ7_PLEPL|nr:unnamed protein product [Pleuronectes platessa]